MPRRVMVRKSEAAAKPRSPVEPASLGLAAPTSLAMRQRLQRKQVLPSFESMTVTRDDLATMQRVADRREAGHVRRLEATFREFQGGGHAVAFDAGRTAFQACLAALGVGKGDQVVMPAYTCVVVPNAVQALGAVPVFVDIELDTWGPSGDRVADALTARTRAVLVQHSYGLPARDTRAIVEAVADRRPRRRQAGAVVIEDCAHATGARLEGKRVGTFGALSFTSFERSKVLSTVMGGMAYTQEKALGEKLGAVQEDLPLPTPDATRRRVEAAWHSYYRYAHPLRRWTKNRAAKRFAPGPPSTPPGEQVGAPHVGTRLAGPLAALGLGQLQRLDAVNELRRQNARRWQAWCADRGLRTARPAVGAEPVWLRFPFAVAEDEAHRKADSTWVHRELGVHAGTWFESHLHPSDMTIPNQPNADVAVRTTLNLPGLL